MSRYTRFPNGPRSKGRADDGRLASDKTGAEDNALTNTQGTRVSAEGKSKSRTSASKPQGNNKPSVVIMIFLISLMIPIQFFVGSLLLTPFRVVLLIAVIPLFFKWVSGETGKIYALDFVFMAYVFWMGLTLFANHGAGVFPLVGITTVETIGAFLVGRVLVRNATDFEQITKFLKICLLIFVFAAVLESAYGIRVFSEIAGKIGKTHNWVHASGIYEKRLGMYRSHVVFEHPILFGVFSSTAFGMLFYSSQPLTGKKYGLRRAWVSVTTTFFSLSSGAFLSLAAQIGLASWDKIMGKVRKHWKVLVWLVIAAYIVVDLLSNRTPFEVFITYAAFSAHNGYMRITIFLYGMDNVWAHPILGMGHHDWVRPSWLGSPSVDNFWLLMGMRHGFPGFLLIAASFLGNIIRLSGLSIKNQYVSNIRTGVVISFIGLSLALMTVHIWGATYIFVCFLLGATTWLRDYVPDDRDEKEQEPDSAPRRRGAK